MCVAFAVRMSMACAVCVGHPGRSAARKSDAYSFAPVTLATPSIRPAPVAAGFQPCLPGSVSRAANSGSFARARRDRLSAMPLAVTSLANSRREAFTLRPHGSAPATANGDAFIGTGIDRQQARLSAPWSLQAPFSRRSSDQIDDAVAVSASRDGFARLRRRYRRRRSQRRDRACDEVPADAPRARYTAARSCATRTGTGGCEK
ncbi:MAG: hypothetical protein FD172_2985 [Methylocystaceae bacterium]|nr:MAG: hypothetical protein FD172_2985 [Methylocystaceae bacterium]